MTLQIHMKMRMYPTVILPEPTPDTDAEPTGGIGWKTTMRVFSADIDNDIDQYPEENARRGM